MNISINNIDDLIKFQQSKKLIVFDLDGTLTESKSSLSEGMSYFLSLLLSKYSVAIISGGAFPQFEKQLLKNLTLDSNQLRKLFLFPTCATTFYKWNSIWKKIYSIDLTIEEKIQIYNAFNNCFKEVDFIPTEKPYGEILEDRGSQITFSALGQLAPYSLKKNWDLDFKKRLQMVNILKVSLPNFEIKIGGSTSIDITHKNIDKAFGINKIQENLGFKIEEILFIGDALFENGNDNPVISTGIDYIQTSGPKETEEIIFEMIKVPRYEIEIGKPG